MRGGGRERPYLAPRLALSDLGLQGAHLALGLLQLSNTLTCSTLIARQLALLLIDQPLHQGEGGRGREREGKRERGPVRIT